VLEPQDGGISHLTPHLLRVLASSGIDSDHGFDFQEIP
jgi:hypothetical protein